MSYIVDFAETSSFTTNVINGFDIVGLDKSESITQSFAEDRAIASGTINDLIERSSSFDFIQNEIIEENSIGTENEAIVDEIDSELVEEGSDNNLLSGIAEKGTFALEFFAEDGAEVIELENGEAIIRSSSSNAEVTYDRESGTISIENLDPAQSDISLYMNDESYEIF